MKIFVWKRQKCNRLACFTIVMGFRNFKKLKASSFIGKGWWRGQDLNLRPLGYEPNELPDCSTPHREKHTQENEIVTRTATLNDLVSGEILLPVDIIHLKSP